ncbi:amino acid adenylation domain-containing protein [Vibrio sp. OCN044]|uniref:Amino acid adenylation domain-containing protein n=1 Tax=Vibrio tetraodonis subsp. pristinus TaxID=2695891 RepID=A0A6L8LQ26_9VIBR|nr:amino acid adenylation domain-containing protein [Vibrio tetraodonis]MYM58161.1 amino acid adenylation domain-containing protein [Vibrio tetraodonis subsp. pristinus]
MTQSELLSAQSIAKLSLSSNQNWTLAIQRQRAEQQSISSFIYQEYDYHNIDADRLEVAIRMLVANHPMLNAEISDDFQILLTTKSHVDITVKDLSHQSEQTISEQLEQVRTAQVTEHSTSTITTQLSLLPDSKIRLHVRFNSIIVDQPSVTLFFKQLEQILAGKTPEFADLEQVVSIHKQSLSDEQDHAHSNLDYWREQVLSLPTSANLPTICEPDKLTDTGITRRTLKLSSIQWNEFVRCSQQHKIRADIALASVFSAILSLWSKQQDLMLRIDLNQGLATDHLIGQHTQPLILGFQGSGQDFLSLAKANQQQFEQSYTQRQTPIFEFIHQLTNFSEGHRYPANIAFSSELSPNTAQDSVLGMPIWGCRQSANTWLSLHACIEHGELTLHWDSLDYLFPRDMVQNMLTSYGNLLESLCQSSENWTTTLAAKLPRNQELVRSSIILDAASHALPNGLLHDRFWQHAIISPTAPAVIHGKDSIDYQTLAQYAQCCAGALLSAGVKPGDRVAVTMGKGIGQIVSVLSILYAGGIYVPVSPDQPQERREKIYKGAGINVILVDTTNEQTPKTSQEFQYLDWTIAYQQDPLMEPQRVQPDEPAYIIYTSGSTGTPKGVVISHQGALNTCIALNDKYRVNNKDRVLALSALHFDLSVYDIFGLLSAGGAVVLVDEEQRRDPSAWVEAIESHQVTMWNSVPALFDMLLTYASSFKSSAPERLRLAMLSGDWIGLDLPQRYRDHRADGLFIAMGGATEASIWSNVCDVEQVSDHWRSIPYGRPLPRQKYRVVDDLGRDCPDWVAGELWIGGDGVALGYFNDDQKTQAQFLEINGEVWYRTGDMGCYWPDGTLEFLGRQDKQVKVGGYRIELGEIEVALNSIDGVQRAVTIALGNKDKTLAAFVVLETEQTLLDAETVQNLLSKLLPNYMVPQRILFLDTLPLTGNGKVDHKALAQMTSRKTKSNIMQDKPLLTDTEIKVGKVWSDILNQTGLNKSSNFFQLGGDTYCALEFVKRCHEMGYPIKLSMLYRYPDLEPMALIMDRCRLASLQRT